MKLISVEIKADPLAQARGAVHLTTVREFANMEEAVAHLARERRSEDHVVSAPEVAVAVAPQPSAESVAPAPQAAPAKTRATRVKAPEAAPVAPPALAEPVVLGSEIGDIELTQTSPTVWAARPLAHPSATASGPTADEALAKAIDHVQRMAVASQPPVVEAPAAQLRLVAQPSAGNGSQPVAPELLAAGSFRAVIGWMLANGYTTVEAIAAKCAEVRDEVPAVARLTGDLTERVQRAFEVLQAERAAAKGMQA